MLSNSTKRVPYISRHSRDVFWRLIDQYQKHACNVQSRARTDQLTITGAIRLLAIRNVNDDFNRESLRIEIDTSLPSARVIRALDELIELRGPPKRLRLDNGPELISAALHQWAQRHGVELVHIQPGKPTQNAYIERFNRTFRTEVLDRYVFTSLDEVRRMTEDWRHRYNHDRPHRSLGGLSPIRYAMAKSPSTSTFD